MSTFGVEKDCYSAWIYFQPLKNLLTLCLLLGILIIRLLYIVFSVFYFVYCRGFCILKKIFLSLTRREERRNGSLGFMVFFWGGVYIHLRPQISVIIWRTSAHQQRVFFKIYITAPHPPQFIYSSYGEIFKSYDCEHRDRDAWKTNLNRTCILSRSPLTLFWDGISLWNSSWSGVCDAPAPTSWVPGLQVYPDSSRSIHPLLLPQRHA